MFFGGPDMFNLLYTILYATRPLKNEQEKWRLCVSSFFLDRLSTCQINHFLFSVFWVAFIEISNVFCLIILASESLLIFPRDIGCKSCRKQRICFISCWKLCLVAELQNRRNTI